MKEIPKYVEKLLARRQKLAEDLLLVSAQVDEYCEKIGVDMTDDDAAVLTNVAIYMEPWNAIQYTRSTILAALNDSSASQPD